MTRFLLTGLLCLLLVGAGAAQVRAQVVTLDDVIMLAQSGISDETIRVFLETRDIEFVIGAAAIATLRAAGVSEEIIRYLIDRAQVESGRRSFDRAPTVRYAYPSTYYDASYAPGLVFSVGLSSFPHWWHDHHCHRGIAHCSPPSFQQVFCRN